MRKVLKFIAINFCITSLIFLAACSSGRRGGDGPPPYPVDVSKIPNAVPRCEPISKYGNKKVYWVKGKPYCVMSSCKNYEEVGVASWYGTMFHKHLSSSGERYNMLAMTAAHKSLPLPTYVEVTNLQNHKTIIVKVNDRGPFKPNRIIDLSYVAAKKLGMLAKGTALVRVKAIDPIEYANRNCTAKPHSFYAYKTRVSHRCALAHGQHYLQVGAFKKRLYAERMRRKLLALTHAPVRVARSRNMYHVQIGPMRDMATEDCIKQRLHAAGVGHFVVI